jgi:hypothetical protein
MEKQQCSLARRLCALQFRANSPGASIELRERELRRLRVSFRQERICNAIRVIRGTLSKKRDNGGALFQVAVALMI